MFNFLSSLGDGAGGSRELAAFTKESPPSLVNPVADLATIEELKTKGNDSFGQQDYTAALDYYTKALLIFQPSSSSTTSSSTQDLVLDAFLVLTSNRSATLSKLQRYKEGLSCAEQCLALKPSWTKALFRKAEALVGLESYEQAEELYKQVLQTSHPSSSLSTSASTTLLRDKIFEIGKLRQNRDKGIKITTLHPGTDICTKKTLLQPLNSVIFTFAKQLQNQIHLITDIATGQTLIVDPCWDVDGILEVVKKQKWKIVGILVTHHHFDHCGGIPPPPFDKYGVRVQGCLSLLKEVNELEEAKRKKKAKLLKGGQESFITTPIKLYVSALDFPEIVKTNPELEAEKNKGRVQFVDDATEITLPMPEFIINEPMSKSTSLASGLDEEIKDSDTENDKGFDIKSVASSLWGMMLSCAPGSNALSAVEDNNTISNNSTIATPSPRTSTAQKSTNSMSTESQTTLPTTTIPTQTNTIRVITTPGHSPGSVSYLLNNSHLFSGDVLFISSCGRLDFPDSSLEDMYITIDKLKKKLTDDVMIMPGHSYGGLWTSVKKEKKRGVLKVDNWDEWVRYMSVRGNEGQDSDCDEKKS